MRFGDNLFVPPLTKDFASIDLHEILQTQTWPSYSAQSQKVIYAQMAALRDLYRRNDFAMAAQQWCIQLVLERSIVWRAGGTEPVLVLQVWDCAALAWPLVRVASDFIRLDTDVEELQWMCLYDFGDLQVIVEARSAIRLLETWRLDPEGRLGSNTQGHNQKAHSKDAPCLETPVGWSTFNRTFSQAKDRFSFPFARCPEV